MPTRAGQAQPGPSAGEREPDTTALTHERFARMRPFGGAKPSPIDDSGLPPGPRWPTLAQSVALIRFRHRFVPYLQRRYGDAVTVRILPAGRPLVLFGRPEHAKEIFAGDPAVFHAGKGNAILGPIMGEHSLLLQDGMEHQRARRLLMPAFNGQALTSYRALVERVARAEVATWEEGATFRAQDRMNALTLEVILTVVFGVTDEERLAALRPRVKATVEVSPAVLLGWGFPALRRFGPWRRTVLNAEELDRLIFREIRERRTAGDLADRTDVLSRLLRVGQEGPDADGLDDVELRDQLVTLLLAGHETTATALAWALYELGRDRDQLRRAREAAGSSDDEWLQAVLEESMRLHPVIPMVVRTLQAPATVGGYDLPAGVTVGPSIILAHRSPENHPDPERFDPGRFVGRHPAPHTWIPFGGGVRRCIGAGFSLMEGVAVLRAVLAEHDVEAVGSDHPRVRNITSVPHHGARIRVTRRPV